MSDLRSIAAIARYYIGHQMRYKARLFGMVFTHPIAILFQRYLPALIIAGILDRLSRGDFTPDDLWGSFGGPILIAIGLEAVGAIVIWRVVVYCNWTLEGLVIRDIHRQVYGHLMRMSASFHANHFGGALVSQANKLAGAYQRLTDTTVFQVLGLFWALVFTAVLLVGRAPWFVLGIILFATAYLTCAVVATRKVRRLNSALADTENTQTGFLADSVTNVMAIKSFAASQSETDGYAKSTENVRLALRGLMRATLRREAVLAVSAPASTRYQSSWPAPASCCGMPTSPPSSWCSTTPRTY